MKYLQRFISILLLCSFVLTCIPTSVLGAEDVEYSIANGYVKYSINGKTGGFSIETAEGHPQKKYDNNIPLLYKEDKTRSNGTSFTTVRIGGKDYIFGQEYGLFGLSSKLHTPKLSDDGRILTVQWNILDYEVIQEVALSSDANSDITGNVGISYTVKNNGKKAENVGVRVLLDTALGNETDAPYITSDKKISPQYTEYAYEGEGLPEQIRMVDSLSTPTKMAYTIVKGWNNDVAADKIIAGHWANLANTRYDYKPDEYCDFTNFSNEYKIPDSALAFYWSEKSLAGKGPEGTEGSIRKCELLYGVGNFTANQDESTIGIDIINTEIELTEDKKGYENNGEFTVTVNLDNSVDGANPLLATILNVTADEGLTLTDGGTINYESIAVGEVKSYTFKVKANTSNTVTSKGIYVSVTGTEEIDGVQKTVTAAAQKFVLLPRVASDIPDIQMTSINPGIIYKSGERSITVTGKMSEFDALNARVGWDMYLVSEKGVDSYRIPKNNISFLDEYKQMSFRTDAEMTVGKYKIEFRFTDKDLIEAFGTSKLTSSASFQVSADEKYKQPSYGVLALVRYDTDKYKFVTFASESDYLQFYKGELEQGGIKHNFTGDIGQTEIMAVVKGHIKQLEKEVDDNTKKIYYQASSADSPIVINNMLVYSGDEPLTMSDDGGRYSISGDGLLKVINSITVWRNEWSIDVTTGQKLTLDKARNRIDNAGDVQLSLGSAATMIQSIGGFLVDLKFGVLTSELQDDGATTYGISFGGSISIPIKAKKKQEEPTTRTAEDNNVENDVNNQNQNNRTDIDEDDDYGDSMNNLFKEDEEDDYGDAMRNLYAEEDDSPRNTGPTEDNNNNNNNNNNSGSGGDDNNNNSGSGGDDNNNNSGSGGNAGSNNPNNKELEKSTLFSDGNLSAEVRDVRFGQKDKKGDNNEYETGFIGIDTTVSLTLPENVLGSFVSNPPIYGSITINTIKNEYMLGLGIKIKVIECEGTISFKEVPIKEKPRVVPNNIEFYIRDGLKIPLVPAVLFMNGLGGGINNLADSMADGLEGLPPITLLLFTRLNMIETMIGDFDAEISLQNFKLNGDMTFAHMNKENAQKIFNIKAGLGAQWVDPWYINLYGDASIIDGLIKGGINITIGDETMFGYLYASICVPDDIPIVGGSEIAGVEAAVSDDFIGANLKIIGVKLGVVYYWDGNYKFGQNIDLSSKYMLMGAPLFGKSDVEAQYEAIYGTNLHRLVVKDVEGNEITLFGVTTEVKKEIDPSAEDSFVLEIPYTGYGTVTVDDITVENPDGKINLIPASDDGSGNFLVQNRTNGTNYIYVSITDRALLKKGVWTVTSNNENLKITTFSAIGVDNLPEITGTTYTRNDFDLNVSWTTDGEKNEDAVVNVYLTEDENVLENMKSVSSKNDRSLGTLIGTKEIAEIKSGTGEFEIPDSFANGKYYVVTTIMSKNTGLSMAVSDNAFEFTNPNLPNAVKEAKLSYGGNSELLIKAYNPDDIDYTDYIVEIVPEDGSKLDNAYTQVSIGKNPLKDENGKTIGENIILGKEANLKPGTNYKAKVTTLRQIDNKFYYGPTVETNVFTLPEPQKPKLLSVETNVKDSGYLKSGVLEIKYTFDRDVWMILKANSYNLEQGGKFRKEWIWRRNVNDGEYIIDFEAYSTTKDFVTGSDFPEIKNAIIGITTDTEDPILTLTRTKLMSISSEESENVEMYVGNNVVVTDDAGNYTIEGLTEENASLYENDVLKDVAVDSGGVFKLTGKLEDGIDRKEIYLKATDEAGNFSELVVCVLRKGSGVSVDSITITSNDSAVSNKIVTAKVGDVLNIGVLGAFNNGERKIDNSDITWELLKDKGILSFDGESIRVLAPGEAGIKAKYITLSAENNQPIGPEDYLLINVIPNDRSDLKQAIDKATETLNNNQSASDEKKQALTDAINKAQAVYDDPIASADSINSATIEIKAATDTFMDNDTSSGGGGGSYSSKCKVTVEPTVNGKVTVSSTTVKKGTSLTITSTPDEGYRVADVKINGVSYGKDNVITVPSVNENLKIEVVFVEKWDCPFTDVHDADWFYDTVEKAYKQGLMNGVSDTLFAPDENVTRGMFVTVLYRAEGEPAASELNFVDVPANEYYANAVSWANANGIVNGVSETEYAPDANITREQMAAILYRYAQYKGYNVSDFEDTNILSYDDYESVSEWAISSMQYAVGSGLIKGKTESTLNPQDNATRAEMATILIRFINTNVK